MIYTFGSQLAPGRVIGCHVVPHSGAGVLRQLCGPMIGYLRYHAMSAIGAIPAIGAMWAP
jgi:hypothetical protein